MKIFLSKIIQDLLNINDLSGELTVRTSWNFSILCVLLSTHKPVIHYIWNSKIESRQAGKAAGQYYLDSCGPVLQHYHSSSKICLHFSSILQLLHIPKHCLISNISPWPGQGTLACPPCGHRGGRLRCWHLAGARGAAVMYQVFTPGPPTTLRAKHSEHSSYHILCRKFSFDITPKFIRIDEGALTPIRFANIVYIENLNFFSSKLEFKVYTNLCQNRRMKLYY